MGDNDTASDNLMLVGEAITGQTIRQSGKAVTVDNQDPGAPTNDTASQREVDGKASRKWDKILHAPRLWQHLQDGFFFWMPKYVKESRKWPRGIIMLLRIQFLLICALTTSAILVTIFTNNNTFNKQMEFTFDKLILGAYPAAPTVVGTIKIGWFLAGWFWFTVLLSLFWMLWPRFYINTYIKHSILRRMDGFYLTMMAANVAMFTIVMLGIIGVTNVLLITFFVCTTVGLFIKDHFVIPMHYSSVMSAYERLFPVFTQNHAEPTMSRMEPDLDATDNANENGDEEIINGQDGLNYVPPASFAKMWTDFLVWIRGISDSESSTYHPVTSTLPVDQHDQTSGHYATVLSHSLVPYYYAFFDEGLSLMCYIALLFVYYGAAINNYSSAFQWEIHFFFWTNFLLYTCSHIFTRIYWSNTNIRIVRNKKTGTTHMKLGISHLWYTGIMWSVWIFFSILSTFFLLGFDSNLAVGSTLPPY